MTKIETVTTMGQCCHAKGQGLGTRIAFITNVPSHFHRGLFEMIAENYDTQFFFFSRGDEEWIEERNELEIGRFKARYLRGVRLTKHLRVNAPLLWSLVTGRYTVFIHSINGRFELLTTFLLAKVSRKPFILWTNLWHHPQTLFHRITFRVTRSIYRHADAIVCYGFHVRDYLVSLGVDELRIFFSWNVTDNSLYGKKVPARAVAELRAAHGLKNRRVILFVGRLAPEKGVVYLLEAFASLPRKLQASLMLVGDGPDHDRLRRYVAGHSMNNVVFLDYIQNQDLPRVYAAADVFVLPSVTTRTEKEPWGIVINEAMNQSCPVIATTAVGAAMGGLIKDGKNGVVVGERDAGALGSAITKVLRDKKFARRLGSSAAKEIRTWDHRKSFVGFQEAIQSVLSSTEFTTSRH